MTVEFERRDFLNRTIERQVLPVGSRKVLKPQSLATPMIRVEVIAPDTVKVVKNFAGENFDEIILEKDRINRSPHTFSYINRFNIAYKKS